MMGMQRELRAKASALLVVVCMLLCALGPVIACLDEKDSSAAGEPQKEEFLYVSIGDSITNGYGMDGYYKENDDVNYGGFLQEAPDAYPSKIAEMLSDEYDVNLIQLAVSGFRSADLRSLIDPDFESDIFSHMFGADHEKFEDYLTKYTSESDIGRQYSSVSEYYREKISEADLITYNLGSNDFGTFITAIIGSKLGLAGWDEEYQDVTLHKYLGEEYGDRFEEFRDYFAGIFQDGLVELGLGAQVASGLADAIDVAASAFAYGIVGFMINYDRTMEVIYELNPDVDVVVVDIYNAISGVEFTFGDYILPIGSIYGAIIEFVNLYTKHLSPYATKVAHADLDGVPQVFFDEMKSGKVLSGYTKKSVVDEFGLADIVKGGLIEGGMSETEASAKVKDIDFVYDTIDGPDNKVTALMKEFACNDSIDAYAVLAGVSDMDALSETIGAHLTNGEPISEADKAMVHIYLRAILNDGLFAHPNSEGNDQFAEAIWDAYQSIDRPMDGWSAIRDRYINNVVTTVKESSESMLDELRTKSGAVLTELDLLIKGLIEDDSADMDDVKEIIPLLMDAGSTIGSNLNVAFGMLESGSTLDEAIDALCLDTVFADLNSGLTSLDNPMADAILAFPGSDLSVSIMELIGTMVELVWVISTNIVEYDESDTFYYESDEPFYLGGNFTDSLGSFPSIPRLMDIVDALGGPESDGRVSLKTVENAAEDLIGSMKATNVIVVESDSGNIDVLLWDLIMNIDAPSSVPLDFARYSGLMGGDASEWMNDMEDNIAPLVDAILQEYPEMEGSMPMVTFLLRNLIYNQLGIIQGIDDMRVLISETNPDATMFVTGMYNQFTNVTFIMDGTEIDIGAIYDVLVRVTNLAISEYCETMPQVVYVDITGAADTTPVSIEDISFKQIPSLLDKLEPDMEYVKAQVDAMLAGMEERSPYTDEYDGDQNDKDSKFTFIAVALVLVAVLCAVAFKMKR